VSFYNAISTASMAAKPICAQAGSRHLDGRAGA
jgi:hypothetical protein